MAQASTDIYELIPPGVKRLADSAAIPNNASNADWQTYQAWLAAGNTPRPLQPDSTHVWDGVQWVQDPGLADAANNQSLQQSLSVNDADTIRSLRMVVSNLARLTPAFPPPANSDQQYLLDGEQQARQLRNRWKPPATQTLPEAKARRKEELRIQGLAYIQIGFVFLGVTWNTSTLEQLVYMTLGSFVISSNLLMGDQLIHIWDASGTEQKLSPANASKLGGALLTWVYLAQKEYYGKVAEINACKTPADVYAVVWDPVYSSSNLFNGDTFTPITTKGFDWGFNGGFK